nr:AMP-binding protein [Saprospiraceae bacterium]
MPEINNLVSLLRKRSAETPLFTPLVYLRDGEQDEQPITYRQLDESAQKLAGHFQSLNLKGKRILITIPQSIEYFVSFFGCLYAGVIAVPSNPPSNNRNMERLQTIIKDSGADFILADQSLYNFFKKKSKEVSENNFLIYEDLLRSEKKWTPHPVDKNDIAYLQYSSGSTGDPKGIKISHENVMTNAKGCVHALPPNLKRVVSWIPIFHDMGLISMLTYIFVGDVCCYFMNPAHFIQKPIRWFDAIHRYRGQYTVAPNFSFDLLCKKTSDSEIEKLDLSCLKSITCGSEKVRLHTIRNFYKKFGGTDLDLKAFKPSY